MEKHFSKIVGTKDGKEARLHIWKDESGVHITLDYNSDKAFDALDEALSTKCMEQEKYDEMMNLIYDIMEIGEP